jgi:type II secretory pathway pseudopilin PulG
MSVANRIRANQTGDTIVEVLISIAVVSAVLGSAYAIVSRTVNNSQQVKEHSQALKVAEAQLERLRSAPNRARAFDASLANAFCMPSDLTATPPVNPGISLTATSMSTNVGNYDPSCKFADDQVNDRFLVAITRISDVFKVYVTWDGATGGQDSVSLSYKVYQ